MLLPTAFCPSLPTADVCSATHLAFHASKLTFGRLAIQQYRSHSTQLGIRAWGLWAYGGLNPTAAAIFKQEPAA